ncbi:uncharacterized protein MONOS_11044 [Monocercomonoides exilis]|uniref:uncharacterized protein n=1 Tax=Monocercomonoides exilis TaxID=2049356 RepID=UPI00355A84CA|nr:hypothetical protein MONOS_11044 [Monocercomonoides exilis]|eukprot:MONOS_11044.1-p1 / transcript=MONOS_11044.1 / gene=MONOS_11044 / organism=Monocercomonoides_exilis_PA203 / gene_product=unspecified product / transcript_product=unspecified product / location=Mono_scaffold00531:32575-33163(-) / protein_length=150 / sequence_SO=supercontig / SO=protein_coding / is_pseudo=false
MTDTQDVSLTLLNSTFVPTETLTFCAADLKITGNGTDATTIASSDIPQPSSSSSMSSSPGPSSASALFQQTQGSLIVSALAIAHNSTNPITPILFHLSVKASSTSPPSPLPSPSTPPTSPISPPQPPPPAVSSPLPPPLPSPSPSPIAP